MIISDKFIWLHFPKCAGTETERWLRQNFAGDPAVKLDALDPANVIWHQSIEKRQEYDPEFEVNNRAILCNIRRLPAWMLSRVHFEYARSPQHKVTRAMFTAGEFYEATGFHSKADTYARQYSRPQVNDWIRTENLAEDLQRVFAKYLDLGGIDIAAQLKTTNASKIRYIPQVEFYYTKAEIKALYEANPVWASIEREVYGDIYQYRG